MIEPRPYQEAAAKATIRDLRAGLRSLVALPTGTGKTITALLIARKMEASRVLWLAHRDELIRQPIEALRQVSPDKSAGVVKARLNEPYADYVFASVQTARGDRRLRTLARQKWDLVVVDEGHHAVAPSYQKILNAVSGPQLLLTATPERGDNAAMDQVCDTVSYQMDLLQAVQKSYLVPPRIATHRIDVDLDKIKTKLGDFAQGALEHELLSHGIVESVTSAWKLYCSNRKTIVFCVGVEQARQVADAVGGAVVHGSTPTDERRKILDAFAKGEIHTIANCAVLTEGFDEPTVDAIIMARPTTSKPLYIQCIGRGLRLYPGKMDCLIIDMVGASEKHTLMQAPVLFGELISDREMQDEATATTDDFFADEKSASYWRQRYEAQIAGLTKERRGHLRWVQVPDGLVLGVGDAGTLIASNGWTLEVLNGNSRKPLTNGNVDLQMVQGIAEDYVRRAKNSGFSNGGTRWRSRPITPKQLELITKHDLGFASTQGEATDLLTAHYATAWYNQPATGKQLYALRRRGHIVPDGLTKGAASRMLSAQR